jgi:hypothetical protein
VGTNLAVPDKPRLVILPAAVDLNLQLIDENEIVIHYKLVAPENYAPAEIALSYAGSAVSKSVANTTCTGDDIEKKFSYVPPSQAKEKYGTGVGKNFRVIQISIVNRCTLPVLIPLAGIYLASSPDTPGTRIYPFSLDHVTSIFSYDRQFSGRRAVYFNVVQALATVGSAVEPFLASGFTKGVSILGGSFTQASLTIWKDMTAEQLQSLTSQSYQATEQVGPNGGSLQKFVFLPISKGEGKGVQGPLEKVNTSTLEVNIEIIPVLTPSTPLTLSTPVQ